MSVAAAGFPMVSSLKEIVNFYILPHHVFDHHVYEGIGSDICSYYTDFENVFDFDPSVSFTYSTEGSQVVRMTDDMSLTVRLR